MKFDADEARRLLREAEWQQRENSKRLKGLQRSQQLAQQKLAAGRTATPTAPPRSNPPPPPRTEPAAASLPHVSTAAQQHARQEALVIAKEAEYRQLIANPVTDMNGPQAEALRAEVKKLRAKFDKVHSTSTAQRSTAAPAATLGTGAGIGASTSAPPPPRSAPSTPTVPVETPEQRK